eukprot:TRINITY_DN56873_c0_g1_i1.p1 TRINITY_DN56873_c0_g1~~TRINITY_DN56873_c0_g1_i1.p1  ORF type:complete len:422 (+),score=102.07 TRINITY_DN56873_c0_g1_i1:119-1384(+)
MAPCTMTASECLPLRAQKRRQQQPIDSHADAAAAAAAGNVRFTVEVSYNFAGVGGESLPLRAGERLEVLLWSKAGWWYCRTSLGKLGWAPSTLLQPLPPTFLERFTCEGEATKLQVCGEAACDAIGDEGEEEMVVAELTPEERLRQELEAAADSGAFAAEEEGELIELSAMDEDECIIPGSMQRGESTDNADLLSATEQAELELGEMTFEDHIGQVLFTTLKSDAQTPIAEEVEEGELTREDLLGLLAEMRARRSAELEPFPPQEPQLHLALPQPSPADAAREASADATPWPPLPPAPAELDAASRTPAGAAGIWPPLPPGPPPPRLSSSQRTVATLGALTSPSPCLSEKEIVDEYVAQMAFQADGSCARPRLDRDVAQMGHYFDYGAWVKKAGERWLEGKGPRGKVRLMGDGGIKRCRCI